MDNCIVSTMDFPRCGTCIYWNGPKEVLMNMIKYDMYSTGKCGNGSSAAYGQSMRGDDSCLLRKGFE